MPKALCSHFLLLLFAFAAIGNLRGEKVHCPDGRSFCPDDTTCCQLSDEGHYGCCPLPNAICCNDHLHCCPENTQCDLQRQTCMQSDGRSLPFHRKIAAKTQSGENDEKEKEVICPDGSSKCPSRTTCCPLGDGFGGLRREFWRHEIHSHQSTAYGCCPAEQAVCCADHVHCCPHGTQCDTAEGACEMDPSVRICGDSVVSSKGAHRQRMAICEGNEKCCHHQDEEEGKKRTSCCPFENGQCCAHSAHCCPMGFACAREEERCVSEQNGISFSTQLIPTRSATKKRFHGVKMPTECADGTFCGSSTDICCPHALLGNEGEETTTYNCCPLSKGICCKGSEKCCPMGYRCSPGGGCERIDVREQIVRLFLDKN